MNRLDTLKFAIAAAVTLVILNVACAVALETSPDATLALFNSWMHGIDVARLVPPEGRSVTLVETIAGAVALGAISLAAGALFAGTYNWLLPRFARRALFNTES